MTKQKIHFIYRIDESIDNRYDNEMYIEQVTSFRDRVSEIRQEIGEIKDKIRIKSIVKDTKKAILNFTFGGIVKNMPYKK